MNLIRPTLRKDIAANVAAATSLASAFGSVLMLDGGRIPLRIGGMQSDAQAVGNGLRVAINSHQARCLPLQTTANK